MLFSELKQLAEALPNATLLVGSDGRILGSNSKSEELFGYSGKEFLTFPVHHLVPERFRSGHADLFKSFRATKQNLTMGEYSDGRRYFEARKSDGKELMTDISVARIDIDDQKSAVFLVTIIDRTYQFELEDMLERRANSDGLTGLNTRRSFVEGFNKELLRSKRYLKPLSLVSFDLDFFKSINDTYGHAAGDHVLQMTGVTCLQSVRRNVDVCGRLGGEEFGIYLPDTDIGGAESVAEKLRQSISEIEVLGYSDLKFTASFGVTEITSADTDFSTIYQRADDALYKAKNTGRNRVCVT